LNKNKYSCSKTKS